VVRPRHPKDTQALRRDDTPARVHTWPKRKPLTQRMIYFSSLCHQHACACAISTMLLFCAGDMLYRRDAGNSAECLRSAAMLRQTRRVDKRRPDRRCAPPTLRRPRHNRYATVQVSPCPTFRMPYARRRKSVVTQEVQRAVPPPVLPNSEHLLEELSAREARYIYDQHTAFSKSSVDMRERRSRRSTATPASSAPSQPVTKNSRGEHYPRRRSPARSAAPVRFCV